MSDHLPRNEVVTPEPVLSARSGQALVLTLTRPERLNAIDREMIAALLHHLEEAEADPGIRAVILTGAGERAFSAGADILEFRMRRKRDGEAAARDFTRRGQALTRRIETFPKPVIAAVNGLAFGGGCEITEAAHLALASERAVFGKPEIRLGFPPPFGGTQRLPRLVGRKRALSMILTGCEIDAAEAERIGLVNRVVRHEDLLAQALALAHAIAPFGPDAVSSCLAAVTRGSNMAIDEGLAVEATEFVHAASGDHVTRRLDAFALRRHSA